MNIWFVLWIFFSVFILGVFFWSLQILLRQKAAWKQYAARHNLSYQSGSLMQSPTVTGLVSGYELGLFSEARTENDSKGRKFRTVLQLDLKPGMPAEGVISSAGMAAIVSTLDIKESFKPESAEWDDKIIVKATNPEKLHPYFTPARIKALKALMGTKGVEAMLIFNENETFLRFETPDPLDSIEKVDRLVTKICGVADILKP